MLKWIAVLGNLGVLGFVAWLLVEDGVRDLSSMEFWASAGFIAAATVNLLHIYSTSSSGDDEGLLALWLRVKKAELRKRLDS